MDQMVDRVSHKPPAVTNIVIMVNPDQLTSLYSPHRCQQSEPMVLEVTHAGRDIEEAIIEASHRDLSSGQSGH